jgi:hypothetical protein
MLGRGSSPSDILTHCTQTRGIPKREKPVGEGEAWLEAGVGVTEGVLGVIAEGVKEGAPVGTLMGVTLGVAVEEGRAGGVKL